MDAGAQFVEAPIFGRPEPAVAWTLWIAFAGPAAAKARVRPVLEATGTQGPCDFGETIGAASTMKLIGNFMIGAGARSLREGLSVAAKSGGDPHATLVMPTDYGKMIVDKAPPPAAARGSDVIGRKDLALFQNAAAAVGSPTPLADFWLSGGSS